VVIHADKLQLICFFIVSYLLSRIFVRFELPRSLVWWLLEEKRVTIARLSWLVILGTTLISMFIANVVTLMTMIPVLDTMQQEFQGSAKEKRRFTSLMMLSAVWGANIGGMGMLTGTTSNGILVGLLEAYGFPISLRFTFLSWMSWGIPLSLILCFLGWLILMLVFRPAQHLQGSILKAQLSLAGLKPQTQSIAIGMALFFLVSAAILSSSMSFFPQLRTALLIATAVWTLAFMYGFFVFKFRLAADLAPQSLLPREHILHDLPRKGLMWIGAGLIITAVLVMLNFPDLVARASLNWIRGEQSILLLLLIVGAITTFATELVSNSVIQIAMFMTLFPLSRIYPEISWQMMLVISLSSTCAFMSPIATAANGLGFGSSRRISLPYMLKAGLLMNLTSLLVITIWVRYVVPLVLNLFA